MNPAVKDLEKYNIAVVIPCYRVERQIGTVLADLPLYLSHIIVVDDASPDETARVAMQAAQKDSRILLVRHEKNKGVGGAMVTGFRKALELGADVIVKMDGDGQMDIRHVPHLLNPILQGQADY